MPLFSFDSLREPVLIQIPIEADFTVGISSLITRIPFASVVFLYDEIVADSVCDSLFLIAILRC